MIFVVISLKINLFTNALRNLVNCTSYQLMWSTDLLIILTHYVSTRPDLYCIHQHIKCELYNYCPLYILLYELNLRKCSIWIGWEGSHGNWLRKRYEKRETRYAVSGDRPMLQKHILVWFKLYRYRMCKHISLFLVLSPDMLYFSITPYPNQLKSNLAVLFN